MVACFRCNSTLRHEQEPCAMCGWPPDPPAPAVPQVTVDRQTLINALKQLEGAKTTLRRLLGQA